ncbi:hypothetical protein XH83_27715 [Bradyrhizobium sp. CCBAU 53351]|uniref:hypothetical protein n=1 Tax=Bradyrhizobium sp. CCBAU 53351 TaxID=1325114 RepID=UPI001889546B|nr:hypothetical protein [Bradyrhizobium sp. CCBAU 53351]QOZ78857.1 hypothetical protein XH83_27715 [Bradyrhizobium sp. CCBAU 53351]
MSKRKNTIRDLVGDAPALAPDLASERSGFDGAAPAPGAARVERQSLRQLSAHPGEAAAPASPPRATLKERAHQMSLYLEPATYDALREIAHRERTKMHVLLLQAVDEFLKRRVTLAE